MTVNEKMILYQTARITLRRLTLEDRAEFISLVRASSDLLQPWVKLPATLVKFDEYFQRFDGKTAECMLVCARDAAIAGTVSISNIMRGPYQRAIVGYSAFVPSARKGYLSEGFQLVLRFAFQDLKLHRLEADIQPGNKASLQFAERVGFRREGYSPNLIYIDGRWRDHERWAITMTDRGTTLDR